MSKYTPAVRVFLTFLCAALAAVVATVDDETIRVIAGAIIVGLGAVGIVPPHIPTRTSIDPGVEPVNVIHQEKGQADGRLLYVVAVIVIVLALAWLIHSPLVLIALLLVVLVLFF